MADDHGDDVRRIVREVLDTPPVSEWSVTGPSIRRSTRSRWARALPSTSLVAAAVIALALVTALVLHASFGAGSHHGSALSAGTRGAGTPPGTTVPTPATNPSATSVPPSSPSTIATSKPPATTLPVTTTTGMPAIAPKSIPSSCVPTPSPIDVSLGSATACLAVGSELSVTFTQASEFGGVPGAWIGGATSADPSVVAVDSSSTDGPVLSAQLRGVSPGTSTVTVSFQNECSSSASTTPCTIPPQGQESLTVQVTN